MKSIAIMAALAVAGTAAAQDMQAPPAQATEAAATAEPTGGYQPSTPPLSAPPQPGQQVIFQPSKSPAEAYPAPAPLAEYPICKKGQYDNCRQRGG